MGAEAFPQPTVTNSVTGILVELLDGLRRATSMVDVNVAAGLAMTELLNLSVHGTEQAGELINLVL